MNLAMLIALCLLFAIPAPTILFIFAGSISGETGYVQLCIGLVVRFVQTKPRSPTDEVGGIICLKVLHFKV